MEKIQIEKLVHQQIKDEGRSITWLCDKMRWQRQKYYRFRDNGFIDVNDLLKMSFLLNHNFFQYFSDIFDNECNKMDTKSVTK